jgi:hypothetical protein
MVMKSEPVATGMLAHHPDSALDYQAAIAWLKPQCQ